VNGQTSTTAGIDAVITWVDSGDPVFRAMAAPYSSGRAVKDMPSADPARLSSVNEIRYCLLSIMKFAPFIRNIYIVTAGQDPRLHEVVESHFPGSSDRVKTVDHKHIFRGFENYLPTFSSRSIESMLWRIEGLSENFIYFNDDVFLVRNTSPGDFFCDGRPLLRGKWLLRPWHRLAWNAIRILPLRIIKGNPGYRPRPSYHLGQWRSATVAGFRASYFCMSHTPFALCRTRAEEFLVNGYETLEKNISYRFRDDSQFNFVALMNHLEVLSGNRNYHSPQLVYMQPSGRGKGYLPGKIALCMKNDKVKFACVQSLDRCTPEQQKIVFDWMDGMLAGC